MWTTRSKYTTASGLCVIITIVCPSSLFNCRSICNLDSKNSEIVLQMLRQLNKELGQTIVMITHNPEAVVYFDRVVHMRDGVIVDGIPAD